ncbi:MAG: hypothetical protein FWG34_05210 [Oscillospiraceae bacterium]|nr:hypothetical protein [Oscillospiraceae bacterium]
MKKRIGILIALTFFLPTFMLSCKIAKIHEGTDENEKTEEFGKPGETEKTEDETMIVENSEIVRFTQNETETEATKGDELVLASIDNSETKIGIMTQEYIGDNIAEILMIKYDGNQPALEQYNWKNPEIETINLAIKSEVQQVYDDFMNEMAKFGDDWFDWIEIKSYPFTSDDYLQIVMTYAAYPIYGTDGEMTSYNFSKKENRYVTLEEAMGEFGLDEKTIAQNAKALYIPRSGSDYIEEIKTVGFLFCRGTDPYTIFLLEVTIETPGAGEWKSFYAYEPNILSRQLDEFYELSSYCLFDPYDMDQMDPPLCYGRENTDESLNLPILFSERYYCENDPERWIVFNADGSFDFANGEWASSGGYIITDSLIRVYFENDISEFTIINKYELMEMYGEIYALLSGG